MSTMDHLVVANLLAERKEKALQLLRRMLSMQLDAFGPKDSRCVITENKILMLEGSSSEGVDAQQLDDAQYSIPPADEQKGNQNARSKFQPFKALLGRK